jgi:hypothetical protein
MLKNPHHIGSMMISVLALNRPKHLYITLDSIYRMEDIEKYTTSVMLIYQDQEILEQQLYYISQFPINEIKICYENSMLYYNHLSQFAYLMALNYEWYLVVEDDIILRPDSLKYLESIKKHAFVYCLYNNDTEEGEIRSILRPMQGNIFANLYNKASLNILGEWLMANMGNGLSIGSEPGLIYNSPDHLDYSSDTKIAAFTRKMDIIESIPSKSMALHFGLNAAVEGNIRTEMESHMFAGKKEQWLNNVLQVLSAVKYDLDIVRIFRPGHFEYK